MVIPTEEEEEEEQEQAEAVTVVAEHPQESTTMTTKIIGPLRSTHKQQKREMTTTKITGLPSSTLSSTPRRKDLEAGETTTTKAMGDPLSHMHKVGMGEGTTKAMGSPLSNTRKVGMEVGEGKTTTMKAIINRNNTLKVAMVAEHQQAELAEVEGRLLTKAAMIDPLNNMPKVDTAVEVEVGETKRMRMKDHPNNNSTLKEDVHPKAPLLPLMGLLRLRLSTTPTCWPKVLRC